MLGFTSQDYATARELASIFGPFLILNILLALGFTWKHGDDVRAINEARAARARHFAIHRKGQ